MMVDVIGSRGARRDCVDLYVAAQAYGLREIFEWFTTKYASVPHSRMHLFKALTYFKDAEQEPMPDMLIPLDWPAITRSFLSQVPLLTRLS